MKHPQDCSCAVPCRSCGHESEQHAGSLYGGTGPRRCLVTGCSCKGCYIGSTPARCKQTETTTKGSSAPIDMGIGAFIETEGKATYNQPANEGD